MKILRWKYISIFLFEYYLKIIPFFSFWLKNGIYHNRYRLVNFGIPLFFGEMLFLFLKITKWYNGVKNKFIYTKFFLKIFISVLSEKIQILVTFRSKILILVKNPNFGQQT